ncbi:class I SAM-dependent methyltransferase [Solitalea longa]|uniref:Class I SAM-dependent methyltransferase n=1 Tax=Solitalea longa TaxID=2079460 RepID=A0A2S5A228_9SPHI|nr:methyltransferase domain-containing protein [Solitalea longa]POY36359.1 class I SAM-dependent methyltransferase [Solitalea longa]
MKKELIQDIIQWDVHSWSKILPYWDENINWEKVENCLELGGREGGLSLWLALKGKKTICSDLKDVRYKAEKLHAKYGLHSLIEYQDIDAAKIPYENHFDIIAFKSIIGGVGLNDNLKIQFKVFDEINKALKPGGKLLFAENLKASVFHQTLRKNNNKWRNAWRYVALSEIPHFLKDYSNIDLQTTGVTSLLGRSDDQKKMLHKLDEALLNKICPPSWRYIAYGIAEKI